MKEGRRRGSERRKDRDVKSGGNEMIKGLTKAAFTLAHKHGSGTNLFILFLCNIASVVQTTFKIVQKSRSREHGDTIISTRMYIDCARALVPRHPRARYCVTFQESCN